jgi:two-component system phosphate regulon sensor histidine kinase PhoR
LLAENGELLGDSRRDPPPSLRSAHGTDWPEFNEARRTGQATRWQRGDAAGAETIHVALRFAGPEGLGVLRLSRQLGTPPGAGTRWLLAGLAAAGAAALGLILGQRVRRGMAQGVRSVIDDARRVARGETPHASGDVEGLRDLADGVDRLAREFRGAVAELAGERDRFEAVLESMSDAVLVVDGDQRITLANRAAVEKLRIDGPATGRLLYEVVRASALPAMLRAETEGPVRSVELELPGTPSRSVLVHATRLGTGGGQLLVMHDVTEMRRLETVRRDFVANVSHELRTPVSVVLANAETLLDGAIDDRERAPMFLRAIHANAQRLSQLIADLLDLSRIEAGRFVLDRRPVPVIRALQRATEAMQRATATRRQTLVVESFPDLVVLADAKALDQVLLNLLDNAVKYTPEGGRIEVGAKAVGAEVRLEIRDDGPGIEPRHQARIFERFYRVDPGRSREMGGTGLGLAIVKHLVDAMGGTVGVELRRPHGSCFWLTLPAFSGRSPSPG